MARISSKIATPNYEMWLQPIECVSMESGRICLRAPNQYVRLWFESNYLDVVLHELKTETSEEYQVEIEVVDEPSQEQEKSDGSTDSGPSTQRAVGRSVDRPANGSASSQPSGTHPMPTYEMTANEYARSVSRDTSWSPARSSVLAERGSARPGGRGSIGKRPEQPVSSPLNPRYTFDSFVSGPSNQLAHAAAQAAANTYPPKYNPIFICGGVGLGKTHLLHSIGHHFGRTRDGARIMYLSGERFMNEYIHAIRTSKMHEFRRRYREGCDVLLVDDVQFLAGKDGTQEEFFHTFNALHDSHRQIVLTADRKPNEISDIADRLRTRFAWGLLADIEPPALEVRVAILRKKAEAEGIDLPNDVALYIAGAIKSNVRELEGALIRLAAQASLLDATVDLPFAQHAIGGAIAQPHEYLTAELVIKTVASYYGLKVSDIRSARRHKSVSAPRAVAMYLARTHTDKSYPELGRAFGGKHHTTVISAVDKITKRLPKEPSLSGEIRAIEGVLLQ